MEHMVKTSLFRATMWVSPMTHLLRCKGYDTFLVLPYCRYKLLRKKLSKCAQRECSPSCSKRLPQETWPRPNSHPGMASSEISSNSLWLLPRNDVAGFLSICTNLFRQGMINSSAQHESFVAFLLFVPSPKVDREIMENLWTMDINISYMYICFCIYIFP